MPGAVLPIMVSKSVKAVKAEEEVGCVGGITVGVPGSA